MDKNEKTEQPFEIEHNGPMIVETQPLTLVDEEGREEDYVCIDRIEYQGKEYMILLPDDDQGHDPDADAVVMAVEPVDDDNENAFDIQDENVRKAVYDIFKKKWDVILSSRENAPILTLTDEDEADVDFVYLGRTEYAGKEYLVLLDDNPPSEIVVLEVIPGDDESESFQSVQDEDILNAVLDTFVEAYADILPGEEE